MKAQIVRFSQVLFTLLFLLSLNSFAQSEQESHSYVSERPIKNRVGLFTGTSLVPTHLGHQVSKQVLFVPTYGLEYERKINNWLLIGLDNELELQHYVILDQENHAITRNYIYVVTGLVMIQPINRVTIFMGAGHEFTGMQNYTVFKVGLAYTFKVSDEWDIAPVVSCDKIGNIYMVPTFGLSIGKEF